ncbi:MAG: hypothetical protein OHK0046_16170 [Anaerolineae bacterium]
MNFLKSLFGGGGSKPAAPGGDNRGFYVYVRPKHCSELAEVRIDLYNDLSAVESGDGYFVRKTARAMRCPFPAEMTLYFDKNRNLTSSEITDGAFVTGDEYAAWRAEKDASAASE